MLAVWSSKEEMLQHKVVGVIDRG